MNWNFGDGVEVMYPCARLDGNGWLAIPDNTNQALQLLEVRYGPTVAALKPDPQARDAALVQTFYCPIRFNTPNNWQGYLEIDPNDVQQKARLVHALPVGQTFTRQQAAAVTNNRA
jgi:hypothetical protein